MRLAFEEALSAAVSDPASTEADMDDQLRAVGALHALGLEEDILRRGAVGVLPASVGVRPALVLDRSAIARLVLTHLDDTEARVEPMPAGARSVQIDPSSLRDQ